MSTSVAECTVGREREREGDSVDHGHQVTRYTSDSPGLVLPYESLDLPSCFIFT